MKHLLTHIVLLCVVLLAGGSSFADTEYPATFQSGRFIISTMQQFDARIHELHPSLEITETQIPSVEYHSQSYAGLVLHAEGVEKGNKIIQTLTYIKLVPGLWKLVFVENKVCIESTIQQQGESITKWFCDEDPFPIGGFQDLFIVEDANVDLEVIQTVFSEPVVPYVVEQTKTSVPGMMTLADLKAALQQVGSSMTVKDAEYRPVGKEEAPPQPALQIHVQGALDSEKNVDQKFLYLIEGNKLKLKEIDGKICWYAATLDKEICDPVYVPTPVTSLPLELIYSWEATGGALNQVQEQEPEPEAVPLAHQCGSLQTQFSTILKVHFQRSLFDANSPREFQRFIEQFPDTADPMGLLLTKQEKQKILQDFVEQKDYIENLNNLIDEFPAGRRGDCQMLVQLKNALRDEVLEKSAQVFQLLQRIELQNYQLEGLSQDGLTDYQKQVLSKLPQLLHPVLNEIDVRAATDVALQKIKTYIQKALQRSSELELFTVSAMAAQDEYSTLFTMEGELAGALLGHQEKKYFGLSIETGFSGYHYVVRLHEAAKAQGLQLGDSLVSVNGQAASDMTYQQVDKILLDTDKPIDLVVQRGDSTATLLLRAMPLNPLQFFYSVTVESLGDAQVLKIKLNSFEPGLTQAIYEEVQEILQTVEVEAFILDLRGNPGGNTDEAVNTLSLFAKDRIVTLSKLGARHFSPIKTYEAKPEFFLDDSKPLVVMVDENSKSSAEIVASGYQALGRSVTVGQRTYGKLVGQFYIPTVLSNQTSYGLLITAFEFFNVKGQALNGIGVTPDLVLQEPSAAPFDGGVGIGKDIPSEELPEVSLYNFQLDDLKDLGIVF